VKTYFNANGEVNENQTSNGDQIDDSRSFDYWIDKGLDWTGRGLEIWGNIRGDDTQQPDGDSQKPETDEEDTGIDMTTIYVGAGMFIAVLIIAVAIKQSKK
jgi:hypothetical protein